MMWKDATRDADVKPPRMTLVLRSFLDYRIPAFVQLDRLVDQQLHVIFPVRWTPERVQNKLKSALGARAIALEGEKSLGHYHHREANTSISIPLQPGLYRAIANTKPEVVVGEGFFQWTPTALLYRLMHRVPLVLFYERTFHTERRAQWYRTLYRRLVSRFVDACCVNGQESLTYTQSLGIPAERITTGFAVADTERLSAQVARVSAATQAELRATWQVSGLVYLYVGQFIERKGLRQLLEAWARFERVAPSAGTLVLAGSGPEEEALKSMVRHLALKAVRFLGWVDYDELPRYYATADVFVMPTLEDNWSMVVPEAMACGLPVLTSYYNGCWPELVQTDVNGWVFDSFDAEDVVRCLNLCVAQQGKLPQMGRASQQIVSQHTPWHAAQAILQASEIALRHWQRM